jgi:thiamine biosynthesis lipoprotein
MTEACHQFETEAMNTTFILRLRHLDGAFAHKMARMCFDLLEELESDLSRYRPDSDVSRINHMTAGDSLLIHPRTHGCLKRALEAHAATGGLFDATLGKQIAHRKEGEASAPPPLTGAFRILPEQPRIECVEPGRELDLGGIGKGFALDVLREHLENQSIHEALLSAGTSTHLAMGTAGWPVDLTEEDRMGESHPLKNGALSTSGLAIQGMHLCHPDDPGIEAIEFKRVRVGHPEATLADAFSTACLLMTGNELAEFAASRPDITLLRAIDREDNIRVFR